MACAVAFLMTSQGSAQVRQLPKWVVHQGASRCELIHPSNSPGVFLVVGFHPIKRTLNMKLVLGGRETDELRDDQRAIVALDAPAARVETAAWLEGKNAKGDAVIALSALVGLTPEALRTSTRIDIGIKDEGEWAFEVLEADRSVSEVEACHDRLLAKWGIDPSLIRSLKAKPEPVPNDRWFRDSDYPFEAIRSNAAGDTVVGSS